MKSKFSLAAIALAAMSVTFGVTDASAGGNMVWQGRVGYGGYGAFQQYDAVRISDLRACIDDATLALRVGFRAPLPPSVSSVSGFGGFNVSTMLFGNALCDDHAGDDGWFTGMTHGGEYLGYGAATQSLYSGYGKFDDKDIVQVDGLHTPDVVASLQAGNWYSADFDLNAMQAGVCQSRYLEDMYAQQALVFINDRSYLIDYANMELCGDQWVDDWNTPHDVSYGIGYGWYGAGYRPYSVGFSWHGAAYRPYRLQYGWYGAGYGSCGDGLIPCAVGFGSCAAGPCGLGYDSYNEWFSSYDDCH